MAVDQSDQTSQKYHWSLHYSGDYFKLFSFLLVIQKKTRYGLGSTTIFARLRSRKNKQVFCFVFSFFSDHLTARLCSSGDLILIYFSSQGLGQPGEQVFRHIPKCAKRTNSRAKMVIPKSNLLNTSQSRRRYILPNLRPNYLLLHNRQTHNINFSSWWLMSRPS